MFFIKFVAKRLKFDTMDVRPENKKEDLILTKIPFRYAPHLYLGKSMKKKKLDKIKKRLDRNSFFLKLYLLTFATNPSDQLEFFDIRLIRLRNYEGYEPYVIGICRNKTEALELVEKIAKECYKKRGDLALREYLS